MIKNDGTDNTGIASSIQKAVKYLETQECAVEGSRKADVFFTADQPGLDENEVWMFLNQYASQNKKIGTMECKNICDETTRRGCVLFSHRKRNTVFGY